MLEKSRLRKMLFLWLAAGLCLIALGCAPKEVETAQPASQSDLGMDPVGMGKLDARLYYIQSKYGLSSEEAETRMKMLYSETGFTEVAWDNYREWLRGTEASVQDAYEQAKKAELARLRAEGLE